MSELMPANNALVAHLTPELEQLSVVDDLQPLNPQRKYMEYAIDTKQTYDHPDYKFRINDVKDLIEMESELIGKTFLLPGYDVLTQIKCTVRFDSFKIFAIFLNPEIEDEAAVKWRENPKFTILFARNPDETDKGPFFHYNFKYADIAVYGKFYQICDLSYRKHMENDAGFSGNSITLHLFVDKSSLRLPKDICVDDDVFLWKVDLSKLNLLEPVAVVGLSPYFSSDPEGLKVQVLLYSRDNKLKAEIKFLNEFEFKQNECKVQISVIHLTNEWRNISSSPAIFSQQYGKIIRFSSHIEIYNEHTWLHYAFNNKLFVKVTLTYT